MTSVCVHVHSKVVTCFFFYVITVPTPRLNEMGDTGTMTAKTVNKNAQIYQHQEIRLMTQC